MKLDRICCIDTSSIVDILLSIRVRHFDRIAIRFFKCRRAYVNLLTIIHIICQRTRIIRNKSIDNRNSIQKWNNDVFDESTQFNYEINSARCKILLNSNPIYLPRLFLWTIREKSRNRDFLLENAKNPGKREKKTATRFWLAKQTPVRGELHEVLLAPRGRGVTKGL